jgi:hypothetical protein
LHWSGKPEASAGRQLLLGELILPQCWFAFLGCRRIPLQGHIPFAQSRVDTARIARRKAATAAILARGYNPPSAPPLVQPAPSRGLFDSGAAPQPQPSQQVQQQQQAAARARAAGPAGQQSLLSFGFTVQQRSSAVSTGPDAMDME